MAMANSWSDAQESQPNSSPYIDWWLEHEGANVSDKFVSLPFKSAPVPEVRADGVMERSHAMIEEYFANPIPIPAHAAKPDGAAEPWDVGQIVDLLPNDLPANTVLTGIVDTGVALSHRRLRRADGSTRIVSAWQQTATHGSQPYLPFGQELYSSDIDRLAREHSHDGTLLGRLDEEAFNRSARLVEPHLPLGHRDLDHRASHGAHVLDLATGFDPRFTPEDQLDANRAIVVNLPPRSMHGSAGNFLAVWAIFAIERIFAVADALWEANRRAHGDVPEGGYPLVVNFSYGKQAGPKTGDSPLELGIRSLLQERRKKYAAPTRVVMPAGNENVDRGCARALMGTGKWKKHDLWPELEVPWRVLPSDHTSNFVEIWTSALEPDNGSELKVPESIEFKLFVTPPGCSDLEVPPLPRGYHSDLGKFARIYCQDQGANVSFVLAVAPTASHFPGSEQAPAGVWQIRVEYRGQVVNTDMFVQSDQSTMPGSKTGRKSYFDHEKAVQFLENGRRRDSYDYDTKASTDHWPCYGPVQIKGTQNALATSTDVDVVGGYRVSDGKPEIYSSTNDGHEKQGHRGREILDASYPSEDAPSLFGLLGAGSQDGSVVAYRGTSMSAGLATRDVGAALMGWEMHTSDPDIGDFQWMRDRAGDFLNSPNRPAQFKRPSMLKAGVGQVPYPETAHNGRVKRN